MKTSHVYAERPPMKNRESVQNINKMALKLEGDELEDYCKKRGLCPLCAKTRTKKKAFKLMNKNKWELLTIMDRKGSYKVYKGYCVKQNCFTLDQAKRLAGEVVASSEPRRRNLKVNPSLNRSTSNVSSVGGEDSDDDANETNKGSQLAHKRTPEAFPPPELRNAANFEVRDDQPLFVIEKAVEGLHQNSNTILVLELSGLQLRTIDFKSLAEGLKVNSTLTALILENSKLDDEHLSIIASGLEKASDIPLKKLYLRSNQVGDTGVDALRSFLQANNTLERLDLSRNCVTSRGALAIFSAFHRNTLTRIRSINLSHNNLGELVDDSSGIEPFLGGNCSLRILNLEGNRLNDETIQSLSLGMKHNDQTALERLYLGWNSFGDDGAMALAEMLEENTSLLVLGLGENQIQNLGGRALLAALDRNVTLKDIPGLWRNKIDRRFIIIAIRRLLLTTEKNDKVRSKLYEQSPSNHPGRMASVIAFDSGFDDPFDSTPSVGGGTAVSTMSNDADYVEPSGTTDADDDDMPVGRGRKPTHVRVAKLMPQQEEGMVDSESLPDGDDSPYDQMVILQSNALTTFDRETGTHTPIPAIDVVYESSLIKKALSQVVVGKIDTEIAVATVESFAAAFERSKSTILHISCVGPTNQLVLEEGFGGIQTISIGDVKRLVTSSEGRLQVVVVSSRDAKPIGKMFIDTGVPHVVCCSLDYRFRDLVGMEFVQNFYAALGGNKPLKQAFQIARSAACTCPHAKAQRLVSERFMLLPERGDTDNYHNIPVFFNKYMPPKHVEEDEEDLGTPQADQLPRLPQNFVGRETVVYKILEKIRAEDIVRVIGPPGCGKDTVATAACHYALKRRDMLKLDFLFWLPAPEGVVPDEDSLYEDLCRTVNFFRGTESLGDDDTLLDRIEIELESLRTLLVVDARQFENRASQVALEKFISFVLNVGSTKIVLLENRSSADEMSPISHIIRDATDSNFDEATIEVTPLDFKPTAQLFGEVSKFITSSGIPAAHDAAEFAELLEPSYLHDVDLNSLISQRRSDLYSRMGNGIPADVIKAASNMPSRDFIDLIRIAHRPEIFVDSLSALDLEIERRTLQKSKAVDDQNYLRATDLDTLLEELDSMRPEFPTLEELKEEEDLMKADLADAVANRQYDQANELKRELIAIKKKIIKEKRSTNAAKKERDPNDQAKKLEAQVQNMVLASKRRDSSFRGLPGNLAPLVDPTGPNFEVTFAITCGDHRDCSFVVCVGDVLDFEHPAEARGIVCWTNECCQLEGTTQGDALLGMGGTAVRDELSELPEMVKTPYGSVRCATGNALIMGPANFGLLKSPCIILSVGPLAPSRSNVKVPENEEEEYWTADTLVYTTTMLRSCYRSSIVLAKHAELQALALSLSTTSPQSPSYEAMIQIGLQTLVEEVQFSHLRDLHLMARTPEEASLLVEILHDMGHRQI